MPVLTYKQFNQLRRLQNALCQGDREARDKIERLCRRLQQDASEWLLFDDGGDIDMADVREFQKVMKDCLKLDQKIERLEEIKEHIEELEEVL